jgi:hypothetical protein
MATAITNNTSTYDAILSWVFTHLGYPVIDVELREEQIIACIKDALERFSKFAGNKDLYKNFTITAVPGQSEYELPEDCDYVFQCYRQNFLTSIDLGGLGFADDLILLFNTQGRTIDMFKNGVGFFNATSYLKFLGRTFGYEFSWENLPNRKIRIYPKPNIQMTIGGMYVPKVDLQSTSLYNLWIKDWTLACCKEILGNIYQKYNGNIPGAAGGAASQISLRTDLVAEGKEMKDKLMEQLTSWRNPAIMLVG